MADKTSLNHRPHVVFNGVDDCILNFKTHMQVDTTQLKAKPEDVRPTVNRLKRPDSIREMTVSELADIVASGGTFMPSLCPDKNSKSWKSCSGFCIDVDNDQAQKNRGYLQLTSDDALKRASEHGLCPTLVYETFNPKKESVRYRMVFLLADEVTDRGLFDRMAAKMLDLYPEADTSTVDDCRHFYGTDKRVYIMPGAQILPAEEFAARLDTVERMAPNDPDYKPKGDLDDNDTIPSNYNGNSNWKDASTSDGEKSEPDTSDIARTRSMLAVIPVDKLDHDSWFRTGMALKSGGYKYELWDEFNKRDQKRYTPDENRSRWDTFKDAQSGKDVGFGYICELAYRHGWLPANPPSWDISPFYMKYGQLWRGSTSKNGKPQRVTSTPPYILANVEDIETGATRLKIGISVSNGYRRYIQKAIVEDKEVIFHHMRIVDALGWIRNAEIDSANAKNIVEYLGRCYGARWAANLPNLKGVARMGWIGEGVGPFMPYDYQAGGADIEFTPPRDLAPIAMAFDKPKGELAEWVELVKPQREKSVTFRAILAAGFASVLVEPLEIQPFLVFLWGESRHGKTVSVKTLCSIWGNPKEGAGYYTNLHDTDNAIYSRAKFLHHLPLVLDELETKTGKTSEDKRSKVRTLIYDLSYGMEKNRQKRNTTANLGGSWKLLTVSTGETPITDDKSQQGLLNRVLEIHGEPFKDNKDAARMHRAIARQYGTAGRAFVAYLQKRNLDKLRELFDDFRADAAEMMPDHPQAWNMAFLAFADLLAERSIFAPDGDFEEARRGSIQFVQHLARHTKGAGERDKGRNAIAWLSEWLTMHKVNFLEQSDHHTIIEPYGRMRTSADGESVFCVMSGVLAKALNEAGHDFEQVKSRLIAEGLLEKPSTGRGWQGRVSINGEKQRCYGIKRDALDAFLDDGEAADHAY